MDEVAQVEEMDDEEVPMVVKSSAGLEEGVSPHPHWQECNGQSLAGTSFPRTVCLLPGQPFREEDLVQNAVRGCGAHAVAIETALGRFHFGARGADGIPHPENWSQPTTQS